jgi:hypothetical protein
MFFDLLLAEELLFGLLFFDFLLLLLFGKGFVLFEGFWGWLRDLFWCFFALFF